MTESEKDSSSSVAIYKPQKSRFYIILTYSFFAFQSGFLWNAWQPIMRSIIRLYSWSLSEINLLLFLFSIVYCIFIIPFIYLWNKLGIRFVYKLSAMFFLIGTFIRLYPDTNFVQSILIQVGSLITAFGAIMPLIGAAVISSIWFPSRERTLATAVIISFNTLGTAFSPLIGSMMVPDFDSSVWNKNDMNITKAIEKGMKSYLYLHASLAMFCITLILIYFPEKPDFLPCRSSEKSLRIDLWDGIRTLLKNKQFWIVFILNFITFGVNSAIGGVFTSFILLFQISQKEAGLLNTVTTIVTFFAGVFGGWLGDHFRYKKIIIISIFPTILMYILMGLQGLRIFPYDIYSIYIVNTILSFVSNIICPISFEMGCEAAFPVSEEVTTAVLGFATNLGLTIFLAITMIPNIGTIWIPFSYAFLILFLLPLMWFYNEKSNRKDMDYIHTEDEYSSSYPNEYSDNSPLFVHD